MCATNYDVTIKKLQDLSQDWAAQFEKKPDLDLVFSVESGLLTVNGICLNCDPSQIDADKASFDCEFIWIPTVSGGEYEISLDLPFEGPSRIGYINHTSTVYIADPN